MPSRTPLIICFIASSTAAFIYVINKCLAKTQLVQHVPEEYLWLPHALTNILGYMIVLLPGYLTYKYVQKVNYLNYGGEGFCMRTIGICFGEEEFILNPQSKVQPIQRPTSNEIFSIGYHFVGLQISYLTWGVLQEKVMTQEYQSNNAGPEHFKDSQFLVFVNRVLAFLMSGLCILIYKQNRHRCPLYKYAYCSLSNIMSSWCQYEALKYVSFPHQVLAKAAKTIPVMIMGKVILKVKYEYYEYVTSVILSIGMLIFMLNAGNDRAHSSVTTFSGAILLVLYITCDSFTSNWQGTLFKTYNVSPIQMMCFVNFFSCIFTSVSLLQQEAFLDSLDFMFKYPQFILDCFLLSVCSAVGQLFIFSTISKFGPLVFAIITTIRQGLSILLSCIIYNHHLNVIGIFGIALVFVSVLLRIYCGQRLKKVQKSNVIKTQRISV
ncbi:adenosine 3'-phospho 5'-phosphosulfate transporter 1 [Zophobas morio]|uniref:adenosine 3'-phospho 5'-phosphosulfate transporter 1 n=1 Tax=Zophobas morio TaxID=2755281 RepID=UPI00308345E5